MRFFRTFFYVFLVFAAVESCSKKDLNPADSATEILSFNLMPGQDQTEINKATHRILVYSPNSDSGKQLAAFFTLSSGASLIQNEIPQESGVTKNNFEGDLMYSVVASDKHTKQTWTVQASNNQYSVSWGLGSFVNSSQRCDRTYNWYIDQAGSGSFASINCGPSSVTMAIKWADSTFSGTALAARESIRPEGGWWFTNDINSYLEEFNIPHAIIGLSGNASETATLLKNQLDHQQIIILCLDMNYVRASAKPEFHTDKFYPTSANWGHFIVLKGYKLVDGELFFEAYDPFSFGIVNSDQTLKGENRYYRAGDLAAACLPWWNYAFIITSKGKELSTEANKRKLDPSKVPVAHNY